MLTSQVLCRGCVIGQVGGVGYSLIRRANVDSLLELLLLMSSAGRSDWPRKARQLLRPGWAEPGSAISGVAWYALRRPGKTLVRLQRCPFFTCLSS